MSILDNDFKLPLISIESLEKELTTGANKPILLRGIDQINPSAFIPCVGKFQDDGNGNRLSNRAYLFELLASFIAMELKLNVFPPVLIEVDDECLEVFKGHIYYSRLLKSKGLIFGNVYNESFLTFTLGSKFSEDVLSDLHKIFLFDMFIENVDRNLNKPNMGSSRDKIIIYDHETAFSFTRVLPFLRNNSPWLINSEIQYICQNHILYFTLRSKNLDNSSFINTFRLINDAFWQKAESLIPAEWQADGEMKDIKNYLSLKIEKLDIYEQQLKGLLV